LERKSGKGIERLAGKCNTSTYANSATYYCH